MGMRRLTRPAQRRRLGRLGALVAAASIALTTACGGNDADDQTTAVPEGDGGEQQSDEQQSDDAAASIVGQQWVLTEAEDDRGSVTPPETPTAYLQIDENGDVTGTTGCNALSGSAEVSGDSIVFEPLIATRKGCTGALGEIDALMQGVLHGEPAVEVSGETVTLTSEDGTLTLRPAE